MDRNCFLNSKRIGKRKIIIWGAGKRGKEMELLLKRYGYSVEAYVDSDEEKVGQKINELSIFSPNYLVDKVASYFVVVAIELLHQEIKDYLYKLDYTERADFFYLYRTAIEPELVNGIYQDDFGNSVKIGCDYSECYITLIGRNNTVIISDNVQLRGKIIINVSYNSAIDVQEANIQDNMVITCLGQSSCRIVKGMMRGANIRVSNQSELDLSNCFLDAGGLINLWDHTKVTAFDSRLGQLYISVYSSMSMKQCDCRSKLDIAEKCTILLEKTDISENVTFWIREASEVTMNRGIFKESSSVKVKDHSIVTAENVRMERTENNIVCYGYSKLRITNSNMGEKISIKVREASSVKIDGMTVYSVMEIICHHDSHIWIEERYKATSNIYILVNHGSTLHIGKDCGMANGSTILSGDSHPIFQIKAPQTYEAKSKVVLGNRVWLGKGCFILNNTSIGESSIVAPNSVCGTKYPNNCLIMGYPARVVRKDIAYDEEESDPDQILDRTYWKLTDMGHCGEL